MKKGPKRISKGPLALKTGLLAFCLAIGLAMVDGRLAAIPLAGFVLMCLAAPFFPGFGFFAPIITRGAGGSMTVALTFDDGPDPVTTPLLLDLLDQLAVKATFFVIGEKAAAHPELIARIIHKGHLLGNHSFRHSIGMFFRNVSRVTRDIAATQGVLQKHGIQPLVYRPPVGIVTPRLGPALEKTGLTLINFSNRPLDWGNRRLDNLVGRVLKRLEDGDIVLLHDKRPPDPAHVAVWLKEVADVIKGIEKRGMRVAPLADVIGRPIMATC